MPNTRNRKKTILRHIKIKLLKTSDKIENLKSIHGKKTHHLHFTKILTIYYGAYNMYHSTTYYNNSIKIWREKMDIVESFLELK